MNDVSGLDWDGGSGQERAVCARRGRLPACESQAVHEHAHEMSTNDSTRSGRLCASVCEWWSNSCDIKNNESTPRGVMLGKGRNASATAEPRSRMDGQTAFIEF